MVVPLDHDQEPRFERLRESLVLAEDLGELFNYQRSRGHAWGYDTARAGE